MSTKQPLPPDDLRVPVACPHCGVKGTSKPTSVTTIKDASDRVNVTMQCGGCAHVWIMQKLVDDQPPQ